MGSSTEVLVNLVQATCVIIVAAQLIVSVRVLRAPLEGKGTLYNTLLLIAGFGILAIYSSYSGFRILGAIINVRDLSPMIAGLIGGPVAGIGAGLIGGIHRFSMGGPTAVPCSIATVLAGFIAGFIYIRYNRVFCGLKIACIFANASYFVTDLKSAISTSEEPVRFLLLDATAIPDFDSSAADSIKEIHEELRERGITMGIAGANCIFLDMMAKTGIEEIIGMENIFPTIRAGIISFGVRYLDDDN